MAWKLGCNSPRACIMTFATSYVSLVYYTRTLSNTVEAFLFVLLMSVVVSYWSAVSRDSHILKLLKANSQPTKNDGIKSENSDASISSDDSGSQKHKNKSKNRKSIERERSLGNYAEISKKSASDHIQTVNRTGQKFSKHEDKNTSGHRNKHVNLETTRIIPQQMISLYAAAIGLILVFGFFNRPTFPLFAAVPCIVFLICDMYHYKSFGRWLYICIFKIFKLSAWASVCSILIILCDSFYYGSITTIDFDHLFENFNNIHKIAMKLTITPWNFIKYNTDPENLAEHGLHPYYQHLLVNTPLLFGILAAFPLFTMLRMVRNIFSRKSQERCQTLLNIKCSKTQFLIHSYLVPIILLSYFPHQEPRFLIPLLCPIALLYGHHLFDGHFKWYISLVWVFYNVILCGLFYGALHQGGLIPSIYEVRDRILREPYSNYHVIFSHTYMPPRHLFQIPDPYSNEDNKIFQYHTAKFKHPNVEIHDLKGKPVNDVHQRVSWLVQDKNPFENIRIFVIAPSSLDKHFCTEVNSGLTKIEYQLVMSFVPQITTENPPNFMKDVFNCMNPHESQFCNWTCSNSVFDRFTFALSLNLYSVLIPVM